MAKRYDRLHRRNLVYQPNKPSSTFMEASGRQVPEYGCHEAPKGTRPRQIADRSHTYPDGPWFPFLAVPSRRTNTFVQITLLLQTRGLQLALHRLLRRFSLLTEIWHQIWRPSRQFHRIFLVLPGEEFMTPSRLALSLVVQNSKPYIQDLTIYRDNECLSRINTVRLLREAFLDIKLHVRQISYSQWLNSSCRGSKGKPLWRLTRCVDQIWGD